MIPRSFDEWYHCITVDCGIALSGSYITKRIRVLSDPAHPETKKFTARYGEAHTRQVVCWLQQARKGIV
jgi:hypothetical protein